MLKRIKKIKNSDKRFMIQDLFEHSKDHRNN